MLNSYYTIKKTGQAEQTIQKSRFITHMKRVTTENEAKEFIETIKKEHWNANHNCSAYVIGENDEVQKANDDGEPSGTAGVPMLNVLLKQKLKDTVVVVTRYFGGIKLGAGGLIRAYGSSVSVGIEEIGAVERSLMQHYEVTSSYELLGKIENELRQSAYMLIDINYAENVTFLTAAPVEETTNYENWLVEISNDRVTYNATETSYVEEDREKR
ncbi:YigZ family protein [Geomicrobium sp. JCM 19038]|uniref:YigZ family protein n=1 Tax=Geomicrobium sp. JCM 19038 TaxID=1460635 RepID=UPI00045F2727|nr:YigZ family protein [Geomicrobium sp. JCM 19038]GAK07209.1 protein co-occurring with transport systems [Geomicrobium sp. JCM 19038]